MRLFFAYRLSVQACSVIQRWQALSQHTSSWRWTPLDKLHMTLGFVGPCEEALVRKSVDYARDLLANQASFTMQSQEIAQFPVPGNHILALLFHVHPSIELLYQQIQQVCFLSDLKLDHRSFAPHVTLARNVSAFESEPFECALKVDHVQIINSDHQVYHVIEEIPLSS